MRSKEPHTWGLHVPGNTSRKPGDNGTFGRAFVKNKQPHALISFLAYFYKPRGLSPHKIPLDARLPLRSVVLTATCRMALLLNPPSLHSWKGWREADSLPHCAPKMSTFSCSPPDSNVPKAELQSSHHPHCCTHSQIPSQGVPRFPSQLLFT